MLVVVLANAIQSLISRSCQRVDVAICYIDVAFSQFEPQFLCKQKIGGGGAAGALCCNGDVFRHNCR